MTLCPKLQIFTFKGQPTTPKPGDIVTRDSINGGYSLARGGVDILIELESGLGKTVKNVDKDMDPEKAAEILFGYPVEQLEEYRSCVKYKLLEISFPEVRKLLDWINRDVRYYTAKTAVIKGSFSSVENVVLPETKEIMQKGFLNNLYIVFSTHCDISILVDTLNVIMSEKYPLSDEDVDGIEKILHEVNKEILDLGSSIDYGIEFDERNSAPSQDEAGMM